MRLLCAWCEKEGKPALIAEVEQEIEALRRKVEEDARRAATAAKQAEEDAHRTAEELRALRKRVDP